jgi:hypothetical protein
VSGLGPKFILRVYLQNASNTPILNTRLVFSYDSQLYMVKSISGVNSTIPVPILLPGPKHCYEAEVMCVDAQGRGGQIVVLLISTERNTTTNRYCNYYIHFLLYIDYNSYPILY